VLEDSENSLARVLRLGNKGTLYTTISSYFLEGESFFKGKLTQVDKLVKNGPASEGVDVYPFNFMYLL